MKFYCGEDYKAMSRIAANIISAQIIMKPNICSACRMVQKRRSGFLSGYKRKP